MRVFLFIIIFMFIAEAKPLFSNSEQAEISQYINSLKELVIATQKTRGLTNSYLNGNLIALMLVQDAKNDMKKAIGKMESLELASDPVINQRATDVSNKLVELNRKGFKLKPEVAFERYTQEIEQILMLAQAVGKRSAEHMTPFAQEASFVMMEKMLPLSEYVGQLRGMGAGIAAKGEITKEQKETLAIVIREIVAIKSELKINIEKLRLKSEKNYSTKIDAKTSKIDMMIEEYVEVAKKEFYKNEISLNPDEYFTKGTEIITEIVLAYDETNRAILNDSKGWI